jgi:hypothetical protein
MAYIHGCRQHTQIDDALSGVFDKDQRPKIAVSRQKEASLLVRTMQQYYLSGLGTTDLGRYRASRHAGTAL